MKVKSKHVYGGLFVDKFFLTLEDGSTIQVSEEDYNKYKKGDDYDGTR